MRERDSRQRAQRYLEDHPKADVRSLGGDSRERICKLAGRLEEPSVGEAFPHHAFYRFEWHLFSGRPDPIMYLAVSEEGDVRELCFYVDFGLDDSVRTFFKDHLFPAKTPKDVETAMEVYCAFIGGAQRPQEVRRRPEGGFEIASENVAMMFDADGRLIRFDSPSRR